MNEFCQAIVRALDEHPKVFARFLCARAHDKPEAMRALIDALRDLGHWQLDRAAAMDAAAELAKIMKAGREGGE